MREKKAAWAKTSQSRSASRSWRLRSYYGITVSVFEAMMADQGGDCAVCGEELTAGHGTNVDHDHETGQVRGLLCHGCNRAEGLLKGSPLRAEKLAAYLRKHAPKLKLVSS